MPVRKVIRGGKPMYQWGQTGAIYPTKAQAERQGVAIRLSQMRKGKKNV